MTAANPVWQRRQNLLINSALATIVLGSGFMLVCPVTREWTIKIFVEDGPVEYLTFVGFVIGAGIGARLCWCSRQRGDEKWVWLWYGFFALGLLVIGMEEISWGQRILGFETPPTWEEMNGQSETNLHNMGWLQGKSELFRVTFGCGGMLGVFLLRVAAFRTVAAPLILLPWFVVITLNAGVDLYCDLFRSPELFDHLMHESAEVNELLISISGALYAWLKLRAGTDVEPAV